MITNFEHITTELSTEELPLVDVVIDVLRKTNGKPIKSPQLVSEIKIAAKGCATITDVRLRKLVNYIRSNGIAPIIATSQGYFISYDQSVLESQIKSLNERASSIYTSANGLSAFLQVKPVPEWELFAGTQKSLFDL